MKNKVRYRKPSVTGYIVGMLMLPIFIQAQEPATLTWNAAINRALEENPGLASDEANLEATRRNINIARANYLPGLTVLGSASHSKTATFSETAGAMPASLALFGASLSQMIYNEKTLANHKIQKYLYASAEEQYRNSTYGTISAAGQAYIGLLYAIDVLGVQQANLEITQKNLQSSKDRLEVGSTSMQEVLRWETQSFSNQQSIESQKASVVVSRGSLNQILNEPLEQVVKLELLSIENNGFVFSSDVVKAALQDELKARIVRDYLVELGLANSPVLASMDQEINATNRQLKSNKRWAIPNFNFSAGADTKIDLAPDDSAPAGSNDLGYWSLGVSMSWPLVDGGANFNKVKQSRAQMTALELQREDTKNSTEQSIRASVAVVISDFLNAGLAQSQATSAQLNYDLVYDSYLVGESSLLDLLDAQEQKLSADISERAALYTFFIDLLTVQQTIGYFAFMQDQSEVSEIIKELELRLLTE